MYVCMYFYCVDYNFLILVIIITVVVVIVIVLVCVFVCKYYGEQNSIYTQIKIN